MSDKQSPKAGDAAPTPDPAAVQQNDASTPSSNANDPAKEVGGREGPDPTRFGDWEKNGRCIDF
ncbi:MAG: DUF1674 domain-containing protein [Proteobacteria bacterium]|nr:DUF1674 domain-containing protein [Pseudomonadota bacterium]